MNVVGAVLIRSDEIILTKRSLHLKYPGFMNFQEEKLKLRH